MASFWFHLVLVIHLLAFAGLFGSLLGQLGKRPEGVGFRVTSATVWSARTIFVAGIALVALAEARDKPVDSMFTVVKLLVAIVVVGLIESNRKKERISFWMYLLILLLTTANVCVAVFWH